MRHGKGQVQPQDLKDTRLSALTDSDLCADCATRQVPLTLNFWLTEVPLCSPCCSISLSSYSLSSLSPALYPAK